MSQKNVYNYLTAKERDRLSFPARIIQGRDLLKGKVLDFGCGFGSDVKFLKSKGVDIDGYDRHFFPIFPDKRFETILCFYVLNVLQPEEQAKVLVEISRLLQPGGKAYFAVRRDVRYEGFRIHKIHKKPTFQCNVNLPFKSIFLNDSCEIYEYKHYNLVENNFHNNCPFCNPNPKRELIAESATVFAIFDKYPVSNGHALIIPKKHCTSYFDLSFKEQQACWFMANEVKRFIEKEFEPDGFNIGININKAAGQTVPHVHIHIIPRYKDDVKNPTGGVRGVIPEKQNYKDK